MESDEWPKISDIKRRLAQRYKDVDVQFIAESKPRYEGEQRTVNQQYLTMQIRHLRYVPRAQPLIQVRLAASRYAGQKYRMPGAELRVDFRDPPIRAMAGQDDVLLLRAGQLLNGESSCPTNSGGPFEESWAAWVDERFATQFERVASADEFVALQDVNHAEFAAVRAQHFGGGSWKALVEGSSSVVDDDGADDRRAEIFIVHGRGEQREAVVQAVAEITGRRPIVLQERPDGGSPTVIEKLEREADRAGWAIIIFSGDDEGRLRQPPGHEVALQPRARQNVVAELGFFIGRLSRDRVKVLYEHGVELPSDFSGIVYMELDQAETWRSRLAVELSAMGVPLANES